MKTLGKIACAALLSAAPPFVVPALAAAMTDRPVFSVQYHPEASPGPMDSHYLFKRFVGLMREKKAGQPKGA